MNGVVDSSARRRLEGRRRRKRCDEKARRTTETAGLRRWTGGQVEAADEAAAAADAERSANQSVYYGVAGVARVPRLGIHLRLYSAGHRAASGRHYATLHRRHSGQC